MKQFDLDTDPAGLLASEKLDGVWCVVHNGQLETKGGKVLPFPTFGWAEGTEGELWAGRGRFQAVQSAVQSGRACEGLVFHPHHGLPSGRVNSASHLAEILADVVGQGGEGLVLTCPHSGDQWKVKPRHDAEAAVLSIAGRVAVVRFGEVSFRLTIPASGVSVGDEVTFAHSGFTDAGIPRHASFLRVRTVR